MGTKLKARPFDYRVASVYEQGEVPAQKVIDDILERMRKLPMKSIAKLWASLHGQIVCEAGEGFILVSALEGIVDNSNEDLLGKRTKEEILMEALYFLRSRVSDPKADGPPNDLPIIVTQWNILFGKDDEFLMCIGNGRNGQKAVLMGKLR
jgi:hypothetical protein